MVSPGCNSMFSYSTQIVNYVIFIFHCMLIVMANGTY